MKEDNSLKSIVALCKRRGLIYPGSEIYGGFANTYTYGPYGVELKKNVKDLWWKHFVQQRKDIIGIDGPILLHPKTWQASGHLESFNDILVDCKECKGRFRVDHLLEMPNLDKIELDQLSNLIKEKKIACPKCQAQNFTNARHFNLMFQTEMSKTQDHNITYLRPETAQAIFLEFKNVIDTTRVKVPFGIAQIGKAFRNEITPGNFIFRIIEFEQMEIEYFIPQEKWEEYFNMWLHLMHKWCEMIGLDKNNIHEKEHSKQELSHYSKKTVDIMYDFPFGRNELYGLAYRSDFDLIKHQKHSGVSQEYIESKKRFIPHIVEPTFGVDRTILALLCEAYDVEKLNGETRTILHFSPLIAPIKVAIFPLMKKEELSTKAKELFEKIKDSWPAEYDESGAIGKRYRRQDELGTPYCLTVDYQTLEDDTVTIRDRDSMEQVRLPCKHLPEELTKRLK